MFFCIRHTLLNQPALGCAAVGLTAALLGGPAWGQDADAPEVRLSETVLVGDAGPELEPGVVSTTLDGDVVASLTPVNNYSLLRAIPGVTGSLGGKDRFGGPVAIRGGMTWGIVEAVDGYPTIDVVPVAAEDGGYTANLSSIIPSIALSNLRVETGGLGVKFGQATGGVVRSQLKRGSAEDPYSTVRLEYNTVGEIVGMAETSGGSGAWDYYVAAQSVTGDYGDNYETHSRALQDLDLLSGLVKLGYRASDEGRFELLAIAGAEEHNYVVSNSGVPYHTEKDNAFLGVRYDHAAASGLRWDVGATLNDFQENRINDNTGLSERNRPQQAFKAFANVSSAYEAGDDWTWSGTHGAEYTDDSFSDVTNARKRFDFGESSIYTNNRIDWRDTLTLNLGLRGSIVDNAFRDLEKLTHNVGLAVKIPSVGELHASHFSGYRLNKAFYLWWGGGNNVFRDPAVGLNLTEAETWEIGWRREFAWKEGVGNARVTYFETSESDLFNFGNSGSGVPFYDDGEANGVEAWVEYNPLPELRLFAGYTHLGNRRVGSTNPNAANLDLRFTPLPEDTASLGGSWQIGERWEWTAMGSYDSGSQREFYDGGAREVEEFNSFLRIDTAVAYQVSEQWMVFGRIENLLDEKDLGYTSVRQESDGSSTRNEATQEDPGILFSFGGQYRF